MNKVNLSRSDWTEIYNALESKKTSPAVGGDVKWIRQLESIQRRIGPDGTRALKCGVKNAGEQWYTVALALPRPSSKLERYAWSFRATAKRAVEIAKSDFIHQLEDPDVKPEDVVVVGLFAGKLNNSVLRLKL